MIRLFLLVGVLAIGSGCKDPAEFTNWVKKTGELREKADPLIDLIPYSREQQEAFRDYFTELEKVALRLKNDKKFTVSFNELFKKTTGASRAGVADLKTICETILMPKERWLRLVSGCTKNGFFLCSEEVAHYPEFVSALRDSLVEVQRKKFDSTAVCSVFH
ncbi:MAG: hypothetical protein AABZ06_11215 [Bdellovibrionota bacterium]